MPKILKIEESKIVTKNKVQMQRVIFSDDKIVYVHLETGNVYPSSTPDKYINLINTYNASHDEIDSTKQLPPTYSLWGKESNYIKDGSCDRCNEIDNSKNLKKLSKNRDTQSAINRMRDFGSVNFFSGFLSLIVICILYSCIITSMIKLGENFWENSAVVGGLISAFIYIVLCIIYIVIGDKMRRLQYSPSSIKAIAVTIIVLCVFDFFLVGYVGSLGLFQLIYAIIALVKVGRYEEWYYGEVE